MIIEHGFHEHLFGQMHEDCAQGNQDEPKKKKKIHTSGNHLQNIVYDRFNGLSNLFSRSWLLKVKRQAAHLSHLLKGASPKGKRARWMFAGKRENVKAI